MHENLFADRISERTQHLASWQSISFVKLKHSYFGNCPQACGTSRCLFSCYGIQMKWLPIIASWLFKAHVWQKFNQVIERLNTEEDQTLLQNLSNITELAVARGGRKAWKQEHLLEEKLSAFECTMR